MSPFGAAGTESMHTGPGDYTKFLRLPSSRRRLSHDSRPRRAPTNNPQPDNRDGKDHPCYQQRARRQVFQKPISHPFLPRNIARKSKFANPGGPHHRTDSHSVTGNGSTAPLHREATRTTAGPHNSRAIPHNGPPTHVTKQTQKCPPHNF